MHKLQSYTFSEIVTEGKRHTDATVATFSHQYYVSVFRHLTANIRMNPRMKRWECWLLLNQ